LETWTPSDMKFARAQQNIKHGCSAYSFFVAVDSAGRIVYCSTVEKGSLHDATAWNGALAFPPVVMNEKMTDCAPRSDKQSFVEQLQAKYPTPLRLAATEGDMELERTYQPCISGDKAYPKIELPADWHLYVTMTAEHDAVQVESNPSAESYLIDGDSRRHKSPEIAQFRSVVERVIGAMKEFKVLMNVALLSQTPVVEIYKFVVIISAIVNYNLAERKTPY